MILRAAAAGGLLAAGAVVGVCAVVVHAHWWGLLLGVAAALATLRALPGRWWATLPFALGWAGTVVVLSAGRAEGDLLVAADTNGYLLLAGALVVLATGVLRLRPDRPAMREDSGAQPGPS